MLDKTYRPDEVEPRQYAAWERSGGFAAHPGSAKRPYTIMMPPPNVTGSLHMGHALTFTLQDILIRFERMRGRDVLWQPGTDHAGIATEIVVTNQLAERQIDKHALGREKFIERVWEWKEESGGTIVNQLRRLGCSPDWARERFTMDPGLAAAVRKVFVQLYREGLIYRDKRLVNWDPEMHTTISDLEVDERETRGQLWHIRYPVEGGAGRFLVVATTRPETMLGDTAVAVHPEDERFADLVGKQVRLPLVGRLIPIVADEYADPKMGSGAVKITPAHDFNDFKVGQRHDLPMINIFDADAHLNENVPEAYRGLDRFAARKQVLADLEAAGLIEKVEDHTMNVPHHDRSGVIVEPWLTDQWYCNAGVLAKPAIEAVETGQTQFVPRQWENTFFEWMRNIQPWCISRQLWWGHQIPAWYAPDGTVFVAESEDEARAEAEAKLGAGVALRRDEDVLDTWFSSGLWPFSTLGWPETTPELGRYYPGDVLVTGFDIIFFWVARMMMMGLHFRGETPFRTVYIHALVRDERGQKMSKSRGNIIDPLDLIDRYGCDALRFTLSALAAPGRDIKLAESRVEGYRNFVTKLWNAVRFAEMNGAAALDASFEPRSCELTINRWIASATRDCAMAVTQALEAYRFDEAANRLYAFVWGTFCDWYLEFSKPILQGDDAAAQTETKATIGWVLAQIVHLLHPITPYVTEEIWAQHGGRDAGMLLIGMWPELPPDLHDPKSAAEMEWVVAAISAIRGVRSEMNVPAGARVPLLVRDANAAVSARLDRHREHILRLARLEKIELTDTVPTGSVSVVVEGTTLILPLGAVVDLDQEKARLKKEIGRLDGELAKFAAKLGNPGFLAKAKPEIVEEQREREADTRRDRDRLKAAHDRLEGEVTLRANDLVEAGLIAPKRLDEVRRVAEQFAVALTDEVAGLIDPSDPSDPIAAQFVPSVAELSTMPEELADPIGDERWSPVPGIVHRYPDRVLLKPSLLCPVYCRFCFRREQIGAKGAVLDPVALDQAFAYIRVRPEIWEVIVTGGDPFLLAPRRIAAIVETLAAIKHVQVIRFHTRVPVVDPRRVGVALVKALASDKAVYVVIHANHPRELTEAARTAFSRLTRAGIPLLSQSVLLRGVNDDAAVLEDLFRKLVAMRVKPYYLHHPDLARGTAHFRGGIAKGQAVMRELRRRASGLCQPTYVLDIPGGHGKVPVGPTWLRPHEDNDEWLVEDRQGVRRVYPPRHRPR